MVAKIRYAAAAHSSALLCFHASTLQEGNSRDHMVVFHFIKIKNMN